MQRFEKYCALTLIALAPLALVASASAGYTNRSASSGTMTMSGEWFETAFGVSDSGTDSAQGTVSSAWGSGEIGWALQQSTNSNHPRLLFNSWQDTGVSLWSRGGNRAGPDPYPITWSVPSLQMNFGVTTNDTIEIVTQTYGSFSANFQGQNLSGAWITIGTWSDLGATKVFNVVAGSNYRFQLTASASNGLNDSIFEMHLTGSGAPAPGALALIGMAGIFGGRRRRSSSRMDAQ